MLPASVGKFLLRLTKKPSRIYRNPLLHLCRLASVGQQAFPAATLTFKPAVYDTFPLHLLPRDVCGREAAMFSSPLTWNLGYELLDGRTTVTPIPEIMHSL